MRAAIIVVVSAAPRSQAALFVGFSLDQVSARTGSSRSASLLSPSVIVRTRNLRHAGYHGRLRADPDQV
jgi:hypothetical protein